MQENAYAGERSYYTQSFSGNLGDNLFRLGVVVKGGVDQAKLKSTVQAVLETIPAEATAEQLVEAVKLSVAELKPYGLRLEVADAGRTLLWVPYRGYREFVSNMTR